MAGRGRTGISMTPRYLAAPVSIIGNLLQTMCLRSTRSWVLIYLSHSTKCSKEKNLSQSFSFYYLTLLARKMFQGEKSEPILFLRPLKWLPLTSVREAQHAGKNGTAGPSWLVAPPGTLGLTNCLLVCEETYPKVRSCRRNS